MTGKFPLPPNFFRCPLLTADESDYMTNLARKSLIDLVRHSRLDGGPIKWTLESDESGLQIFSGADPTAHSDMRFLASTTEVMATIDEAASLFRLDTTELFREYCRMFAKDLMDAASLYTLATPTSDNPRHYIGVKWTCIESPAPLVKPRDWCYLECQDDFETADGQRGWARSLHSVKLPCCPDLQNSLGVVRASFYRTGYVFLETNRPGYLQVIHAVQVDFKGNVPSWVVQLGMKKRARSIGDIDKFLREKRLSAEKFLLDHELVSKSSRSKCFLCHKKYGAFTKKHSCRRCGEVVCSGCSKHWNVDVNGHRINLRVCSACSIGTYNAGLPALHTVRDSSSVTSADRVPSSSAVDPTTPATRLVKRSVSAAPDEFVDVRPKPLPHAARTPSQRMSPDQRPTEDHAVTPQANGRPTYPPADPRLMRMDPYQRGGGDPRHMPPPPYYNQERPPADDPYYYYNRQQPSESQSYDRPSEDGGDYAPLNAKNLEMFTQRQGPPKPVDFTKEVPEPAEPLTEQPRRGYGQYDDGYGHPRAPPSGRGYGGYPDDRYHQGGGGYYQDPRDPRGFRDPRTPSYHDDRYRRDYDPRYEADPRMYNGGYDRYQDHYQGYNPSAYNGSEVGGYPPRGPYDQDPRGQQYGSHYDERYRYEGGRDYRDPRERRYPDEMAPPIAKEGDANSSAKPQSEASSKDADMQAIFQHMERLGLKPADGEDSQQQLLALYKQLQQMNLEQAPAP
ncbi:Aste57867_8507 [Aphanomyces stellatus]|uniref:Aste57867_8507 protein n=1 Tax=Aphanomyces stellatus TaxID=120398 RepID=A0A485KKM9_9STRA|nr:hypothetical protein As57867_008475 [Aphanomyces stellatus]VFT85393.1 Aste57867_8507 [Aphanomyces stellatus]